MAARDLRGFGGVYTVDAEYHADFQTFLAFQAANPNNPMRVRRPNRHRLRGNSLNVRSNPKFNFILTWLNDIYL